MILFDFDGVFVNTFETLRELTRRFDGLEVPVHEYREFFDGHIYEHPRRSEFKSFDDPVLKKGFFDGYNDALLSHPLIPGIFEVVQALSRSHTLHVVTSGDQESIAAFLKHHGLREHFGEVLGWQTHESKVEKFKMLGMSPATAGEHLFITDTLGDLHQAKRIGLPTIGVTWGFHEAERLQKGQPEAIVQNAEELIAAVDRFYRTS